MRRTRIAAWGAAATCCIGLLPAVPASAADEPSLRVTPAPGFAYVRAADVGDGGGAAAHQSSTASATAAATFTPPPNHDFVFRYDPDVPASKRQAFEAAGGIWSNILEVEVPIHVGVSLESFSDPGILGGAGPADLLADDPAFPRTGTWYVSALANQFLGRDATPQRVEIDVLISSDYEFYEGISGPAPSDRVSLLTLALHELGHGLGHTTLARRFPDGTGTIRYEGLPLSFDLVVRDGNRVPLADLQPAALGRALTQRLTWGGAEGIRAEGGLLPELFAPRLFQAGSSASHLDEGVYGTGLMTPFIGDGELHTAVPPLTQAMMADFGWGPEARTAEEAFVTAVTRDFLHRFPTPTEMRLLSSRLRTGELSHAQIASAYGLSDEWIGAVVDELYLTTLGRKPDPVGRRHWVDQLRNGTTTATVTAHFFSSPEYFTRSGSTNRTWVAALYRAILGREPDGGAAAWTDAADGGTPRTTIATSIFQAPESRSRRVRDLYVRLLGRQPDAPGLAAWTKVLENGRDIEVAIRLAASDEYEGRAVQRFG